MSEIQLGKPARDEKEKQDGFLKQVKWCRKGRNETG